MAKMDLTKRENDMKERFFIKATATGYALMEKDFYYSDSYNPEGEWKEYVKEIKAYKTIKPAIKAATKEITYHFPVGHDISDIINHIENNIK